jgi:hypothetical protein
MNKKCTTLREKPFKRGEVVRMLEVPQELFLEFPETQHVTLRAEVGKVHLIQSFNETGQIGLEIYDERYTPHTIWVDPSCVTRNLK